MKSCKHQSLTGAALIAGVIAFSFAKGASGEEVKPQKAQELLEKVKQHELDRQITLKQTEIDRLKEDREKSQKDAAGLQQTLDTTASLVTESTGSLEKLSAQRKHLEQTLSLTIARIEAERRRAECLKNLSAAQTKSLGVMMKRIEENDLRKRLRTAEMLMLANGKPVNDQSESKEHLDIAKLRKALATSEFKTGDDEKIARDAVKVACAKLQAADVAAAKAIRLADGATSGTLEPIAEKPMDSKPAPKPKTVAPKPTIQPKAAVIVPR